MKERNIPDYKPLEELIGMIDEPNGSACLKILGDNKTIFGHSQGSVNNHQAWDGGYLDHVQEAMNIALLLYGPLNNARELPFTLSDALAVLYLHDLEKPWKYEQDSDGKLRHRRGLDTKTAHHQFRKQKIEEYGVKLNAGQENALKYVEGELDDYTNQRRVMNELAAFCHACDNLSARLWFNHPLEASDAWAGAKRNSP